jgi:desulfoferrodoxin-like iron-binding protein
MLPENVSRRKFLEVSAMGAAAIAASGSLFRARAAETAGKQAMKLFVCSICGHVEFGAAPDMCPVCHAPKDKFNQNDSLFTDAASADKGGEAAHTPVVSIVKESKLVKERPVKEVVVRVGAKLHPMEEAHHIMWIDCYVDDRYVSRIVLTPAVEPAVTFYPKSAGSKIRIVEHCNLHGHWQAEVG